MSDKKRRETQPDKKLVEEAKAQARAHANRKTLGLIAAILAVGLGLGFVLTRERGGGAGEAQAQKAPPAKIEAAEAELLKPGPLPEIVLGSPDAKVTIVEYASVTCPACANFHKTILPEIKAKYIDTGKAKLLFREFARDDRDAAGFMLARCAGPEKFYPLVSVLFERQEAWAFAKGSPIEELKKIARQTGMSEETFNACLKDQKLLDSISTVRETAANKFGVNSTPTFFVNGKKLGGIQDAAALSKAIDPLLK